MIDRNKVIRGLECCADWQRGSMYRFCEVCPYNDDPANGTCITLFPLFRDALALLKGDETVPLKPLARWLAGYAMPPELKAREIVNNRGRDIHEVAAEGWEAFLRGMDWEADDADD